MTPPSTETNAQRYVEAAISLRRSIYWNREDSDFEAKTGHEIVYLFDTNVFIFHAHVHDSGTLNEDLDKLVGEGEGRAELSKAMARLTADYLFSGRLPGQKDLKGYISLPHFEESLDKASEIGRKIALESYDGASLPVGKALDDMRQTLKSRISVKEKVRKIGEDLPKAWLDALDAKAHFNRVLRECFIKPGTIVPLDKHPDWAAAGRVEHADLQPWFTALPSPSSDRTADAIRGDAVTLATIVNLYRNDEESTGRYRKRMYVLVTNDSVLINAVRDRRGLLEREGIPLFTRSARDYLPLLNLESMTRALARVAPNEKMRERFHQVFRTLTSAVDWIALAKDDASALASLSRPGGPLQDLQNAWSAISEYVAVLNARHLVEEDEIVADLERFMTGETQDVTARLVETSVRAVRDKHLWIALDSALADLRMRAAAGHPAGPRRFHLHMIDETFGGLLPVNMDMNAYLDSLVKSGAPKVISDENSTNPPRPGAQQLAACIFIAADRWVAAAHAAGRAVEQLPENARGPEPFDARYLLAHTLRFSLRTHYDLSRAQKLLNQNLSAYATRPIGLKRAWLRRLRDEMELGSLLVTAAILQVLSLTPVGERMLGSKTGVHLTDNPSALLATGVSHLRDAYELLLESEPLPNPNDDRENRRTAQFFRALKMLAVTNLAEAYVFEQLAPGLQAEIPVSPPNIADIIETLGEEIRNSARDDESLILTLHIYYHRARALLGNVDDRAAALTRLKGHLDAAREIHDLPQIDVLEFGFIADQLATEPGAAST
ncbi:MAG: hypothetical protein KF730_03405 [Sphingomonas sp.]|uniref:hypothetical protein n=1 Tax=Sphingomonas sp. TaxID=28214 RepID=UPI0025E86AD1|nr:hypothetical protein [Sphingomonas sp.]MBX3563605.1 hypothetical protein [Sphingomonas sp.]